MRTKTRPDVLVVGAGPVGLATALTLNKRRIPVEVLERDDRPGTHSYALALHPRSVAMLEEWGALGNLQQEALRVERLVFCDCREPRYTLDMGKVAGQKGGLLVVGQNNLEAALLDALEKAGVAIKWNYRLSGLQQDDNGVEVQLERLSEGMSGYAMARLEWQVDKEIKEASCYVVGADGHLSTVRRRVGIEFPKVAPTQSFAVFEFKTDYGHVNEARIVFGEEGTSVMWPLPGGYCRWAFELEESAAEAYSRDKDRLFIQVGNQGYHALESSMLEEMLRSRAPWFNGSLGDFRWRMMVRFEKRLASQFGRGRVWLAGDAGHLTGPVGMQSMNIGMNEGQMLANSLADIIEGWADSSILEAYNTDREREWRALLGLSTVLSGGPKMDGFISTYLDRLPGCIPASVDSLPDYAAALGAELTHLHA